MAALSASPALFHQVGVNGFFTSLIAHSRTNRGVSLDAWWSETRCLHEFGGLVHPDAYGYYREDDRHQVGFMLEYDRGTETHRRLLAKLDGYRSLAIAEGTSRWVLFYFETAGREQAARRAMASLSGPVATANAAAGRPHQAVWLELNATQASRTTLGHIGRTR